MTEMLEYGTSLKHINIFKDVKEKINIDGKLTRELKVIKNDKKKKPKGNSRNRKVKYLR